MFEFNSLAPPLRYDLEEEFESYEKRMEEMEKTKGKKMEEDDEEYKQDLEKEEEGDDDNEDDEEDDIDDSLGKDLGDMLERCLRKWGIDRVYCITVDNANANDLLVRSLKECLNKWGTSVLREKDLHMCCVAHITNLVVHDGMKLYNNFVESIRACCKWARQSTLRVKTFNETVAFEEIDFKKNVCLDVPHRWNSSYDTLPRAEKYEQAFASNSTNAMPSSSGGQGPDRSNLNHPVGTKPSSENGVGGVVSLKVNRNSNISSCQSELGNKKGMKDTERFRRYLSKVAQEKNEQSELDIYLKDKFKIMENDAQFYDVL
ncbi:hypothetical protein SLEP1_g38922 [Rubroshorea leprosula]|uniref:Transposase n=1 Tax=Rubroshorea leprosula TaxID=152421 RepID=A0AAV5KYF2_9ROSI|nr:hypothetical protein SLEP1_g38922 [Rubroshorea leprosula]